jgi:hypothetical protein
MEKHYQVSHMILSFSLFLSVYIMLVSHDSWDYLSKRRPFFRHQLGVYAQSQNILYVRVIFCVLKPRKG